MIRLKAVISHHEYKETDVAKYCWSCYLVDRFGRHAEIARATTKADAIKCCKVAILEGLQNDETNESYYIHHHGGRGLYSGRYKLNGRKNGLRRR